MNTFRNLCHAVALAFCALTSVCISSAQDVNHKDYATFEDGLKAISEGDFDKALPLVESELRQHPDNVLAKLSLANIWLYGKKDFAKAKELCLEAEKNQFATADDKDFAHYLLAMCCYNMCEFEECVRYTNMVAKVDRGMICLRAEALFILGELELSAKNYMLAYDLSEVETERKEIIDYLKILKDRVERTEKRENASHAEKAQSYYDQGDFRKSYEEFKKAYEETKDEFYICKMACSADEGLGDEATAIADLDRVIASGNESYTPWAYYRKGWNQLFLQQYDQALENINIAISKTRANGDWGTLCHALYTRAAIYSKTGKTEKAKADWNAVIETEAKNNKNLLSPEAYAWLGNEEKAIELLFRNDIDCSVYGATCVFAVVGRTDEAFNILRNYVLRAAFPHETLHHIKRDLAMERLRENPEFMAELEKSIKRQDVCSKHNK